MTILVLNTYMKIGYMENFFSSFVYIYNIYIEKSMTRLYALTVIEYKIFIIYTRHVSAIE